MKKYKCYPFVVENTWMTWEEHGWGNGYVGITKTHPLYGKRYDNKFAVENPDAISFNQNYIGMLCHIFSEEIETNLVPLDLLIDVHCGVTYSDHPNGKISKDAKWLGAKPRANTKIWAFGFDTAHLDDNMSNWNADRVVEETLKLRDILQTWNIKAEK